MNGLKIRNAQLADCAEIAEIFNSELNRSSFCYETTPHTTSLREEWLARLSQLQLPVLVAEKSGKVVAFGALTPFHPASGYRHTASAQLYVLPEAQGRGVGAEIAKRLYTEARARGIRSVVAGVNSTNTSCQKVLTRMGFQAVGRFNQIAFKNGEWWDDICYQLVISPHPVTKEFINE